MHDWKADRIFVKTKIPSKSPTRRHHGLRRKITIRDTAHQRGNRGSCNENIQLIHRRWTWARRRRHRLVRTRPSQRLSQPLQQDPPLSSSCRLSAPWQASYVAPHPRPHRLYVSCSTLSGLRRCAPIRKGERKET